MNTGTLPPVGPPRRRKPPRPRLSRGATGATLTALALIVVATTWRYTTTGTHSQAQIVRQVSKPGSDKAGRLNAAIIGTLPSPRQQAAAVRYRSSVTLLGGLAVGERPTTSVARVTAAGHQRPVGKLPRAASSTGAVTIGAVAYMMGGRDGDIALKDIVAINLRSGRARTVDRLINATADAGVTSLNGTIYVVGGFTGKRWLRTVVAWRPGMRPRTLARLPVAVRFPAVAAAHGRLIVIGGSNDGGVAARAIYAVTTARGSVSTIGRLPSPLTHSAAVAFHSLVYVIGGRGADPYGASSNILAVNPRNGRVTVAGHLPGALRDTSAVVVGDRIIVVGGARGRVLSASVVALREAPPRG